MASVIVARLRAERLDAFRQNVSIAGSVLKQSLSGCRRRATSAWAMSVLSYAGKFQFGLPSPTLR